MYYNEDKLNEAGQKVPTTWDEFRSVCRAVTKGDTKCLAIAVSASTVDGMIYSNGGKLLSDDGKTWQMNQPPGVAALQMLQEMVKEGTAYYAEKVNADQEDFGKGRTVFTFASSSGIPFYTAAMDSGVKQKWGIANIPHAANVQPVTVLYGGSIAMFKSTPQKQLAAWQFFKYFTSPEVTAEWGVASGYMPVRKSSQSMKVVTDYIAKFPPYATVIKDIAPTAKPETSVRGTQEMRDALENAEVAVITDLNKSPKAALDEAFQKSQKALQQ
jgi:ABC-type glycerol-3-phosphate transport system substrate-binding protein